MTTAKKSKTGENRKLILLKIKRFSPNNKVTKNTVIALLSKNHLKNQDRLKCFSFCSINTSFLCSLIIPFLNQNNSFLKCLHGDSHIKNPLKRGDSISLEYDGLSSSDNQHLIWLFHQQISCGTHPFL